MAYKSSVKTAIKKVITALAQNEQADALTAALNAAYAKIDKAVTKNILHRNTAARYKSRIALKVNKVLKPAA
jgi:small subunit ribosomal protein S20